MSNIIAALADLIEPIDSVEPLDRNPRKGDVKVIARSLERFGQQIPIVVSADVPPKILKGNHTHAAAISLGWQEIAMARSPLTEIEARAFAAADNRASDRGRYHNDLLLEDLRAIADADTDLLLATSFDFDDLDRLALLVDPPLAGRRDLEPDPGEIGPEPDNTVSTPQPERDPKITCPECGHQW